MMIVLTLFLMWFIPFLILSIAFGITYDEEKTKEDLRIAFWWTVLPIFNILALFVVIVILITDSISKFDETVLIRKYFKSIKRIFRRGN